MRWWLLLLVALTLPPSAGATTVTAPKGLTDYVSEVDVTAAPGEHNRIRIRASGTTLLVTDTGAPLVAGEGCTPVGADGAQCSVTDLQNFHSPTVRLGDGDDVADVGDLTGDVYGGTGDDTLVGGARLSGGAGDDVLRGGGGDGDFSQIIGGGGNDRITGGKASEEIYPGPGHDVVDGGAGRDVVVFDDNGGRVMADLSDRRPDGQAGSRDRLRHIEGLYGGRDDDVIRGNGHANDFYGAGGDDILDGRGGADTLEGGLDDDLLLGGAGDDHAFGTLGHDDVRGGTGDDTLGNDVDTDYGEDPSASDETVRGGPGDDNLWAAGPGTEADGGPGDDTLHAMANVTSIDCGQGRDVADSLSPFRVFPASCERMRLLGFQRHPVIEGHAVRLGPRRIALRTFGSRSERGLISVPGYATRTPTVLGGGRRIVVQAAVPLHATAITVRLERSRLWNERNVVRLPLRRRPAPATGG